MKTIKLILVLGTCLWMSGCVLAPDGRWDYGPRHHHSDDRGDRGDRGFCPPGQAKKGNC